YLENLAAAQPPRRDALRFRLLEMAHKANTSTEALLQRFSLLVRLNRTDEAQALARLVIDAEAERMRQLKNLTKENTNLRNRMSRLKRRLRQAISDRRTKEPGAGEDKV